MPLRSRCRPTRLSRFSGSMKYTHVLIFLLCLCTIFTIASIKKRRLIEDDAIDRDVRATHSEDDVLVMNKPVNSPPSYTVADTTTYSVATTHHPCPPSPDVDGYIDVLKELPRHREDVSFSLTPWKVYDPSVSNSTEPGVRWSMIVMVKSHSKNIWERRIARLTWAQRKYVNGIRMETIFIVGKGANPEAEMDLLKENGAYGDLLQLDREEKYIDVIYKTLAGMQYAGTHFPCDWIYTSADDDIMVDLTKMHSLFGKYIKDNTQTSTNITCSPDNDLQILCGFGGVVNAAPRRNVKDKWFVSQDRYSLKRFPPYCMGAWYSMSVYHASEIYKLSKKFPIFWIDDIWVSGILRLRYLSKIKNKCRPTDPGASLPIQSHREKFISIGDSTNLLITWQKYYETSFKHNKC